MTSRFLLLSVFVLSACPAPSLENPNASDAGVADAGVVDGGNLKPVDWVDRRGEPHQLTTLGEFSGTPWGVSADSFIVERNCDGGTCDYEWRDNAGAVLNTRDNLSPVADGVITRDAKYASVLELDERTHCTKDNGDTMKLFRGAWRHVSLEDGSIVADQQVVTSNVLDTSFTHEGNFARLNHVDAATCQTIGPKYRSTRAPFEEPLVLRGEPVSTWLEAELGDGRFLISLPPEKLVLVAPGDDQPWESLTSAAFDFRHGGDFAHVIEGYPARQLISSDVVARVTKTTTLPFDRSDWYLMFTSSRFAALQSYSTPEGRLVLLVDGRGEFAPREFRLGRFENGRPFAVAGRENFAVFFDQTSASMQRIDLATGRVDTLTMAPGVVTTVADGRGVVLQSLNEFWLITATEVLQVQDRPVAFVDASALGGAASLQQTQTVLLITVSGGGGSNGLTAWHVPSGRVVRLTNSLNLVMPFNAPISSGARCETPGFIRAAGAPIDSMKQESSTIHFTEFVPSAASRERLFELPADLSAEPRLLADVPQGECGTPLRAVNNGRFWVPLPTATGVRALVTSP